MARVPTDSWARPQYIPPYDMLQIDDTLISLDLIERYFCCDLDVCKGECCIEGDAGAPITQEERIKLDEILPTVWDSLTPAAQRVIKEQGTSYRDAEGDLVTSIVNGRDCVFTTYAPGGLCLCAIEKACREGKCAFRKPASCALYPVRVSKVGKLTALNFHRWKICHAAEKLGRKEGIRAYQFLKGPLTEHFGEEWYAKLCEAAEAWLASKES